jgi:hypothetical protein
MKMQRADELSWDTPHRCVGQTFSSVMQRSSVAMTDRHRRSLASHRQAPKRDNRDNRLPGYRVNFYEGKTDGLDDNAARSADSLATRGQTDGQVSYKRRLTDR